MMGLFYISALYEITYLYSPRNLNRHEDMVVVGKADFFFFSLKAKIIAETLNNIKYSVKFTVDGINDPSLSGSSYLYLYNSIRFPPQVQKLFGLTIFFSDAEQPTSTWKPVRKGEKHLFDPGEPPARRGSGAGAGTAAPGRAVLPGTQGTWWGLGAWGLAVAWGWMPVGPCVPPSLGASPGQQAVLSNECLV